MSSSESATEGPKIDCDACTGETTRWYHWPSTPPGDKAQLCEACYADVDAGRDKEIVDRYIKNQEAKGRRIDEISFRLEGKKRLRKVLTGKLT